ncbi:MAG: T9SS type A sorting domain-containing protein [Paramuribaculum sp.]|nr:T9SS type A sorting domain-containing protein [Paramuribaculum sp.]MDE6322976.1 T9SS type A sorting domain-containing protein [Paramuribaculum sp.]
MKLFYSLLIGALTVGSASANDFIKLKPESATTNFNTLSTPKAATMTPVKVDRSVTCFYSSTTYSSLGDYYTILSDTETASYNANTGSVAAKNGWVIILDFAADYSPTMTLPAGTYKSVEDPYPDDPAPFSLIEDYSPAYYFNNDGEITAQAVITGDIEVAEENGIYTIAATAIGSDGTIYDISFNGRLPYTDPTQKVTQFEQIREDRKDIDFQGGLAFYYGHFHNTRGGTIMIQLYSGNYDSESGLQGDGSTMICLDILQRYFPDKNNITIDPGTYTIAPMATLQRNQACAAVETDYMGSTIAVGTYIRDRDSNKIETVGSAFSYGYLASGDIVIEKTDAGYHIYLKNGVTDLGYEVTFDYEGPVGPIFDYSANESGSALSTITDDVDLAIDDLPKARCYYNGIINNCNVFLLDIGSRSGRDPERDKGGDIIRMEFVNEPGSPVVQPGAYPMMTERADIYYQPWTLGQTHFVSASGGGTDISGTTYMHFIEDRFYVMDDYAFFKEGNIGVQCDTNDPFNNRVYSFDIDLIADNGFFVKGKWTGPVELMYDADALSAIGYVGADGSEAKVYAAGNGIFRIADYIGEVLVYNAAGSLCATFEANTDVNLSSMPKGIYILKLGKTTAKVVR